MPVFDIVPNDNPAAYGVLSFGVEGSAPGFTVDTDGNASFQGSITEGGSFTLPVPTGVAAVDHPAILSVFAAAEADGGRKSIRALDGVYAIEGSLDLTGFTSTIWGAGASATSGVGAGTVFRAYNQTGPVIDLREWDWPTSFLGKACWRDFVVQGDGTADATLANAGLSLGSLSNSFGGCVFRDIVIRGCGGPNLTMEQAYLCDFVGITMSEPVGATVNDVPWVYLSASNGNRFWGLGLRGVVTDNNCGASGAVRLVPNATYPCKLNQFDGMWVENLDVPTNGSVVQVEGNENAFRDMQVFDTYRVAAATNTCMVRFKPSAIQDAGGNIFDGEVVGNGGASIEVAYGIHVQQSRNVITGVKGYKEKNVLIDAGIDYTTVELRGGFSGLANSGAAWTNNSVEIHNYLSDAMSGDGMVTPPAGTQPADQGYQAWTYDVAGVQSFTVVPTAGLLEVIRIPIRRPTVVTSITLYLSVAGSVLTAGQCFVGLYNSAGALVGSTADQSTVWAANGVKTSALVGGPFTVTGPYCYVGIVFNGVTGPTIARSGVLIASAANAGMTGPTYRYSTADAGVTTTLPGTLGVQTSRGTMWWVALR